MMKKKTTAKNQRRQQQKPDGTNKILKALASHLGDALSLAKSKATRQAHLREIESNLASVDESWPRRKF